MHETAYTPRLHYQGCYMLAADGTLHSPLIETTISNNNLLLIEPDQLTADGVRHAVAELRANLPYRRDAQNIALELEIQTELLVLQKLQEQGHLSATLPNLREARFALGIHGLLTLLERVEEHDDQSDDVLEQLYKRAESDADVATQAKIYLRNLLGLTPQDWDIATTPGIPGKEAIKDLLALRLDIMEANAPAVAESLQQQSKTMGRKWHLKIAHAAHWIATHKQKIGASLSYGIGLPSGLGAVTMAALGIDPASSATLFAGVTASSYLGGQLIATGPGTDALNHAIRNRLRHSPPYSDELKNDLASQLQETFTYLPQRTLDFCTRFDPVFIIADEERHLSSRPRDERLNTADGSMTFSKNLIFLKRECVGNPETLFEEITHYVQSQLATEAFEHCIRDAYLADLGKPASQAFLRRYAFNPTREQHYSHKDLGAEVLVEMALIEWALMDERNVSRAEARRVISTNLPKTGKLYSDYCQKEDALAHNLFDSPCETNHSDRLRSNVAQNVNTNSQGARRA